MVPFPTHAPPTLQIRKVSEHVQSVRPPRPFLVGGIEVCVFLNSLVMEGRMGDKRC